MYKSCKFATPDSDSFMGVQEELIKAGNSWLSTMRPYKEAPDGVKGISVSPDGRMICYTVTYAFKECVFPEILYTLEVVKSIRTVLDPMPRETIVINGNKYDLQAVIEIAAEFLDIVE